MNFVDLSKISFKLGYVQLLAIWMCVLESLVPVSAKNATPITIKPCPWLLAMIQDFFLAILYHILRVKFHSGTDEYINMYPSRAFLSNK